MHVRTWQAAYAHVFPAEELASLSGERGRRRAELHRRNPPLVADANGEVVGFASVGPNRDDSREGEVYAIYVLPDRWGTGVGRELMQSAEAELRAQGYDEAVLWVLEDNPRARRFYEAAGWKADGARKPIEIFSTDVIEIRYRKKLDWSSPGSTSAGA